MKKIQPWQILGLVIGIILFFLFWKVLLFSFHLSIAAAIVAFILYRFLAKKGFKAGQLEDQRSEMIKERSDLLKEAKRDLSIIRRDTYRTPLGPIRDEAKKLLKNGTVILDYLEKNPQQISKSRRFLGYYLDTAAKVLEKYVQVHNVGNPIPPVANVDHMTKGALENLNEAFEKQLHALLENHIIDLEGDIRLMEQMLKPITPADPPKKVEEVVEEVLTDFGQIPLAKQNPSSEESATNPSPESKE